MRRNCRQHRGTFHYDENVFHLSSGGCYLIVYICQNSSQCTLKILSFTYIKCALSITKKWWFLFYKYNNQACLSFKDFIIVCLYQCVTLHLCACRGQKMALNPLELDLHVAVSCELQMWMLGRGLRASVVFLTAEPSL